MSRGFKFAMISGLAAYLTGAKRIIVPESGQGALGPPLVSVAHAHRDYRNHPLFAHRMERLLVALLEQPIRYEFPRLWYTKGETLATLCRHRGRGCLARLPSLAGATVVGLPSEDHGGIAESVPRAC